MKTSVCMAAYDGEAYIREQLESVLSQLGPDDEVVVSDDWSKDATLSVVERLANPRTRIVHNATNLGYTRNFARALSASTGDTGPATTTTKTPISPPARWEGTAGDALDTACGLYLSAPTAWT